MKEVRSKNFIYTAVGAAFGLGSVLRFPALCYEYGAAFVLAYAVVCTGFALPLMSAELSIGKRYRGVFPLRQICPLGGAVGSLSALNCAAMCACYGVIISIFCVRACTAYVHVNYDCPADMPRLLPMISALVFIALAFALTRRANVRAAFARAAILFQAALFLIAAVRGLAYSNALNVLSTVFAVRTEQLFSAQVWLSAVGQALLSLSLGAGVMPAFASDMPKNLSSVRASAIITGANFLGGMLACAATLTLAAGSGTLGVLSHSALSNALTLYPAALAHAFSNGRVCGAFATLFYCSLTLTAFVSALSLARPSYVWVCRARISSRTAAFILSAVLFLFCLPFALGVDFSAVDNFCCNVMSPLLAAGELSCFAYYVLTVRKRRGKIELWKILNT